MSRILIVGLADGLASWLARRLSGVTVEVAWAADDALRQLREGGFSLLVLDAAGGAAAAEDTLRRLRADSRLAALPVIVAVDPENGDSARRLPALADDLRVDRVLLHPLDRGELARTAAALVAQRPAVPRAPAPAPAPIQVPIGPPASIGTATRAEVGSAIAAVWTRSRGEAVARVEALENAAAATVEGRLDPATRSDAEAEAHRLSGALGTFGSSEGTRLARQIEAAFSGDNPLTRIDGTRLVKLVAALRTEVTALDEAAGLSISTPAAPPSSAADSRRDPRPLLLAVGMETADARALEAEAAERGVRLRTAADAARARVSVGVERPDAVVLDLGPAGGDAEAGDALRELAEALGGAPVLVLSGRGALPDRVRLIGMGARTFLRKPAAPGDVLDAAARLLPRGAEPRRVLAVDDDPQILAALRALLEPQRLAVHTLADPLRFWSALEESRPDLLILDVDMPRLSGIELCRVVRADAQWSRLPILFLTAHTDRNTLLRVFAAGADDYVTKPFVGPELSARINARLDRAAG
ncbi:MAG TPA: response regulator [Longimicrobium sp.]|nr:response regulator [Longimicrobium sp.]